MSSFSSVIQKPGKKIVPRAAPRRQAPRKPGASAVAADVFPSDTTSNTESSSARGEVHSEPTTDAAAVEQRARHLPQTDQAITERYTDMPADNVQDEQSPPEPLPSSTVTDVDAEQLQDDGTERVADAETMDVVDPVHNNSLMARTAGAIATSVETSQSDGVTAEQRISQEQSPRITQSPDVYPSATTRSTTRRKTASCSSDPPSPRKRRKVTPQSGPYAALPLVVASRSPSHSSDPSSPQSSQPIQPAYDLLQSATQRAATVSELANSIESQTRLLQTNDDRNHAVPYRSEDGSGKPRASTTSSTDVRRRRRKKTAQEQATEVIANIVGGQAQSASRRDTTPEDAEQYELEPTKVKMGDLCQDSKLGKKSALESEMQANWTEILQRRKEDRERALANAEKRRKRGTGQGILPSDDQAPTAVLAPAMAIVNGVIVVDQASREIDRSVQLQQAAVQDIDNVREDKDYYKYINQGTVGMKPGHGQHPRWDEELTERFLKGLRMFGTDFLMIANLFPGFTRKHIKMKFIREERADKARVLECLRNREQVELDTYAQMADRETEEFQTLESLQKELDEQEKQLLEEDNQRRKREGFATTDHHDPAEQREPVDDAGGAERETQSTEPSRFEAQAREIMEAAVAPRKRQRRTAATSNKRGPKGWKRSEGGVEEVLGSINEVAV